MCFPYFWMINVFPLNEVPPGTHSRQQGNGEWTGKAEQVGAVAGVMTYWNLCGNISVGFCVGYHLLLCFLESVMLKVNDLVFKYFLYLLSKL